MSTITKKLKLHRDVLLEWIYNNENFVSENYSVITNYTENTRSFVSSLAANNNIESNNLVVVDPITNKFTNIDTANLNYIQKQDFFSNLIPYDKLKLYFPASYSFANNGYIGVHLKIYTLDYNQKYIYYFSNFYYNDSDPSMQNTLQYNVPFLFNEKTWTTYLELQIPSIDYVAKQRTATQGSNLPTENSINKNLTNANGLSTNSPIFIEFSFLTSSEVVFNTTYYYGGTPYKFSIERSPAYQTLGVTIQESTNYDVFEIFGTYGNSNENLDDFIDELRIKGRNVKIEYKVSLYEENLLSGVPVTYTVTENFSKKIEHRPIIKVSNTTASIDVEMKVIDLVDSSEIIRYASYGMTNNLFKYSGKLTRINMENATVPRIYNLKNTTTDASALQAKSNVNININKVNYPLLVTNYKVLATTAASKSEYKSIGLLRIVVTPFDNVYKFLIAKSVDSKNVAVPYDLTELLINSTLSMIFQSDTDILEKTLFMESNENKVDLGQIVFKIDQQDLSTIKNISKSNNNFFIVVKTLNTNNRTMLYSGKFDLYEDMKFADIQKISTTTESTPIAQNNIKSNVISQVEVPLSQNAKTLPKINQMNAIVYVDAQAHVQNVVSSLIASKIKIYNTMFQTIVVENITTSQYETIVKTKYVLNVMKLNIGTNNATTKR